MFRIAKTTGALKAQWLSASLLLVLICAGAALAQTTSFTYQGRLTDGVAPANGSYDLQFTLWDALSGGTQQPQPSPVTVTRTSVLVTGGIFTAQLDFGASAFPGADRFLEIGVRPAGGGAFTILLPRQQITSTPYAIRSLNASSADTVTVNGVPSGSGNYVQNNPASPQAGNFNISGNGTAGGMLSGGTVNATTQYNLGGNRLIFSPNGNMFVGIAAGDGITSGEANSFFGPLAGSENSTGSRNSFFGASAGQSSQGSSNTFVGTGVAYAQNVGSSNSFFGADAGLENITGSRNTLIGAQSEFGLGDLINATAIGANARVDQSNSLVLGSIATVNGATTSVNVGIGVTRPQATLDVRGTTLVSGNVGINIGPTNAPQAKLHVVGSSWFQGDNTPLPPTAGKGIVMGFAGEQGYISAFDYSVFSPKNLLLNNSGGNVGIGTAAPLALLHVNGGALVTTGSNREVSIGNPNGESGIGIKGTSNRADVRFDAAALRLVAGPGTGPPLATSGLSITTSGNVGVGQTSPLAKLDIAGTLKVDSLAGGGDVNLCRNSTFNTIATCGSSLRYKRAVAPFFGGLDVVNRLHPIAFTWKNGGSRDLGLGAEDVAKIEPLLVTHNDKGEIEGVKYDRLNIVLINAVKQQQEQIEALRTANAALNARLRAVEKVLRKRVGSARRRR